MAATYQRLDRWSIRRLLCILALLVAVTACGEGGESSAAGGTDGGGDLGTLRVIISSPDSITYVGGQEGNEFGAWDGTGLTVEVIEGNSTSATQALASGDVDISMQTGVRAAADVVRGLEATILATTTGPPTQQFIVAADHPADTPEDLHGATLGISGFGSSGHYSTAKFAETMGWTEDEDYTIVALGGINELTAALQDGEIDAFTWSAASAFEVQSRGIGRVIGEVADYLPPFGSGVIAVRNDVIEERPDALKAFFEGYFDLIQRLQADPQQLVDFMAEEWRVEQEAARAAVEAELGDMSTDGTLPPDALEELGAATVFMEGEEPEDMNEIYTHWTEVTG